MRTMFSIAGMLAMAGGAVSAPPAPDVDDFVEDFESYTPHVSLAALADFVPLGGQMAPNGSVWQTVAPTFSHSGVVNNAIAQTGPNWNPMGAGNSQHGVLGGPDPSGVRGQFLASPRGTIDPQGWNTTHEWVGRLDHQFYVPTATEPLVISADLYLDDMWTLAWFRPSSSVENLIVTNIMVGGEEPYPFACFCGSRQLNFVRVLGTSETGSNSFFDTDSLGADPGLEIAPDTWFTVAIRLTIDGYSVWLRNDETMGANASGMPFDAPGYEGEIFDTGWGQVFPGIDDDLLTPEIEGTGRAGWWSGSEFVRPMLVTDSTGAVVSPPPLARSVDRFSMLAGYDYPPEQTSVEPHDTYVDNYMVLGTPGCAFDPAFSLPQVIDGEDLAQMLADWGTNAARSDSDGDGNVGGNDLAALLARWGPCGE